MKRLLITDVTFNSLVEALTDLEVLLILEGESTEEVRRLLGVIKGVETVTEIASSKEK